MAPEKKSSAKRRKRDSLRTWVLLAVLLAIGCFIYGLRLLNVVQDHFEGRRWDLASRIYSDALTLYPGLDVEATGLEPRLKRLAYAEVHRGARSPGEYQKSASKWEIYLHAFQYPRENLPDRLLKIDLVDGKVLSMRRSDGTEIFTERVEPEILAEFFGVVREQRTLKRLGEIPPALRNAVIAIEDQRFFEHGGVDPRGILRAMMANLLAGRVRQGGSTLTQQLVKNFILDSRRSLLRKINEALIALIIDARYSKEEVLECYLNEIYLGQRGSVAIHGVGEAALHYFGKSVEHLTLGESALLAGMIKGPAYYNPLTHRDRAEKRQQIVLQQMVDQKMITAEEAQHALLEKILLRKQYGIGAGSAYFVDLVRRQLADSYTEDQLQQEGLRIFTSADAHIQNVASDELKKGIERLEAQFPHLRRKPELQGAVVVVHPQTGYLLAVVGGRDFASSQFNRAILAKRQPGSLFKPIVALTAFTTERKDGTPFTPRTELIDEELEVPLPTGEMWKPGNYDGIFHGPMTLREALEKSVNIPMIKLSLEVGPVRIAEKAHDLGIESEIQAVDSIALGTSEVTPFELARAFATIASLGIRPNLLAVRDVGTPEGGVLDRRRIHFEETISRDAAGLTIDLMTGVIDRGTGRGVRAYGLTQPIAGKTGTTSDYRDAWFVGFTPDLLCLVWIGFDDNFSTKLTGSQAALPIWASTMKRILPKDDAKMFPISGDLVRVRIDRFTGELATSDCPEENIIDETYRRGSEPTKSCTLHSTGRLEDVPIWRRVLKWF